MAELCDLITISYFESAAVVIYMGFVFRELT